MGAQLFGIWACLFVTPPPVETRLEQLAPPPAVKIDGDAAPRRRPEITRAVVLLHGLRAQPISAAAAARAEGSYWEAPQAPIVTALRHDTDVYAFHYAQTIPIDDVARLPALTRAVRELRAAGYDEVALIGFSAGGVVARQFVEDTPNSGVTKVVQVCAPNGGSDWTTLGKGVRAVQAPFMRSVTCAERTRMAKLRADKTIPGDVQFVSMVGMGMWLGDGVVRRDAQWTPDLQAQGIPAVTVTTPHVGAMYSKSLAERIAQLVRTPQPRWSAAELAANRGKVLGPLAMVGPKPVMNASLRD